MDDLDDATRYLEENGCNILKVYRDDDGIDSEVESDDLEEIEESEDY